MASTGGWSCDTWRGRLITFLWYQFEDECSLRVWQDRLFGSCFVPLSSMTLPPQGSNEIYLFILPLSLCSPQQISLPARHFSLTPLPGLSSFSHPPLCGPSISLGLCALAGWHLILYQAQIWQWVAVIWHFAGVTSDTLPQSHTVWLKISWWKTFLSSQILFFHSNGLLFGCVYKLWWPSI